MFHLIVFVNLLFLCSERGFLYDNSRKHHLTNSRWMLNFSRNTIIAFISQRAL